MPIRVSLDVGVTSMGKFPGLRSVSLHDRLAAHGNVIVDLGARDGAVESLEGDYPITDHSKRGLSPN